MRDVNKKGKERERKGRATPRPLYYLRKNASKGVEDLWKDSSKGCENRETNGKRIGKLVESRRRAENEN